MMVPGSFVVTLFLIKYYFLRVKLNIPFNIPSNYTIFCMLQSKWISKDFHSTYFVVRSLLAPLDWDWVVIPLDLPVGKALNYPFLFLHQTFIVTSHMDHFLLHLLHST